MGPSASPATPDAHARWQAPYRVDLAAVLGSFLRGGSDPSALLDRDGSAWRATLTPEGPATVRIVSVRDDVTATAWGPGAGWLLGSVPDLLGFADDHAGFPEDLLPDRLQPSWRTLRDRWRVPRSRRVVEALVAAILEQKVTGVQSRRAWRGLLHVTGSTAPGPTPRPMWVIADAATVRQVPSWQWHRWGATPHQAATILRALTTPARLEQCADLSPPAARSRLTAVTGVGGWTAAEVGQRALGDADAVSFGDYHLAHHVVYAFTGRSDGTDEQMAELLEPFAGHRYRVQRIVELSGIARPARGPRMAIADHRRR